MTQESYKDNKYIKTLFESDERLLKYLCQADFIQCLNSLNDDEVEDKDCWPSFKFHKKIFIIPIIEDIIMNNNNKWIDTVSNQKLVEYLDFFENFSMRELWRNWNWNSGYAGNKKIEELYKKAKEGQ